MTSFLVVVFSLFSLMLVTLLVSVVTCVVHEFGHAMTALLLTKGPVKVYIGSWGDPSTSLKLSFGRLIVFFQYKPNLWGKGLCSHSEYKWNPFVSGMLIVLFGPLSSLLFGIGMIVFILSNYAEGLVIFIGVMLLVSSIFDFLFNIIPNKRPIQLYEGNVIYNDGEQLRQLYKYKI